MNRLVIATRRSRLALWQAEFVKSRLETLHAGLAVELLPMSTRGDELQETRLDEAGGKGLFIKELEQAMAEGRADLAVHSMKDVPADLPGGFVLGAITSRDDPRDAFVSNRHASLKAMPLGATVGTSSLRREAQVAALYPGLQIRLLRGNVETRLAKLDRGDYDAIVLAVAGLSRLKLESRISCALAPEEMLPAPGQGALGIECLAGRKEVEEIVRALADTATSASVRSERQVSRALGGNCTIPLGAYAEVAGTRMRLRALVAAPDGRRIARSDCEGSLASPEELGSRVAQ